MRLLPDTLFGRLISALLGVVAVAVLIIVVLIVRDRREFLFAGSEAEALAQTIAETVAQLAALPDDARAAEIERLKREPLMISRGSASRGAPAGFPAPPSPDDVTAALATLPARLARDLGAGYKIEVHMGRPGPSGDAIRVRIERRGEFPAPPGLSFPRGPSPRERDGGPPEPRDDLVPERRGEFPRFGGGPPRDLDVAVTLPDGATIAFHTDMPRAGPPLPRRIFVDLGLLTLALGAVLFVMARTITRPLTQLARAADAVGRGERGAPLRETGARELREATRAFNAMQERMHRCLDSRTQVLAAMSHDLRTPLTRLKLRVESLDDETLADRFNADLDEMQRMVAGALNLFRGMNHDEPLEPVAVDELVAELERELAEVGTRVEVTGDKPKPINARRAALKRCLSNLLVNAEKYGKNPTVAIEDGANELVVRVLDDGPGIPAEMLEQVFEPFFRLEASRNIDTGGVGLGLSIARDIAQAHGGSLTLSNRSPHGLEATLRLPRTPAR
ncbi:MAG TPA: ATP-binding protein [Gammaproteobacteria bacterium]